jgi:hypothetical protein
LKINHLGDLRWNNQRFRDTCARDLIEASCYPVGHTNLREVSVAHVVAASLKRVTAGCIGLLECHISAAHVPRPH